MLRAAFGNFCPICEFPPHGNFLLWKYPFPRRHDIGSCLYITFVPGPPSCALGISRNSSTLHIVFSCFGNCLFKRTCIYIYITHSHPTPHTRTCALMTSLFFSLSLSVSHARMYTEGLIDLFLTHMPCQLGGVIFFVLNWHQNMLDCHRMLDYSLVLRRQSLMNSEVGKLLSSHLDSCWSLSR